MKKLESWVVFSYTLPTKGGSSPRVNLWRRLRRLGTIATAGGIHVLPGSEECIEAFQWLTQEIRQAQGEAVVMHVTQFEGMSDQQMIALFHAARKEDYDALATEVAALEQTTTTGIPLDKIGERQEVLAKLRRRHSEIARIDYFDTPERTMLEARLTRIAKALAPTDTPEIAIPSVTLTAYATKRWITRPRPYIDRIACAWLIRRFINTTALIRYAHTPEPGEVAFDMNEGEFGHRGPLCTFETMLRAFGLEVPGLAEVAEVVHELDLHDGLFARPESAGIDAILKGWHVAGLSDTELEAKGIALMEGLYRAYQSPGAWGES